VATINDAWFPQTCGIVSDSRPLICVSRPTQTTRETCSLSPPLEAFMHASRDAIATAVRAVAFALPPQAARRGLCLLRSLVDYPWIVARCGSVGPQSGNSQVSMTEIAARAKNIQLQVLKVQHRDDLAEAFAAARNAEAQALNIFASPFLSSLSGEIIGVSAAQRLPAIYQWKEHVESGGLVSYGPSLVQLWRQAGTIAAKLLKGAKPADMPVEHQPQRISE
jgi:ABC transporter substrate binding protein